MSYVGEASSLSFHSGFCIRFRARDYGNRGRHVTIELLATLRCDSLLATSCEKGVDRCSRRSKWLPQTPFWV